jgi:dihydroflavonol-4-reductase
MAAVFVTGGTGFLGRALVARLRERGDEVVALARSGEAAEQLAASGAAPLRGDALDEDALVAGMRGCDLAFHVAGVNTLCPTDRRPLYRVNVEGATTAVRAAARAGLGRLVLTSSAATLGEAEGTVGDEGTVHRGAYLSDYERSKHLGERAALAEATARGIDLVCVNPSSVQGPGRSGGTARILLAYLNGRLRAFVDTRLTLVDIADCAEGHLLAADRGRAGERYVLAGATLRSREALDIVSELTGVRHRPLLLPPAAATALAGPVEAGFRLARRRPPLCRAMVRTLLHGHAYDGGRAARELGLAYTPVRETLRRTIEWARAEGLVRA